MAEQKTLIVTPVALFATQGGKTEEKGNCACAIVGSTTNPPRFNLVCYNEQRVTHCSASITSSNEQSIRFQMQTAEYANFCDNSGNTWSMMFLRSSDVDLFCANLGAACFAAAAKPSHNATLCDLSHPNQRKKKALALGDRCKVRFSAFDLDKGETPAAIPRILRLLGTNGDILYNFAAVQSAYSILPDGKGFESSVAGMSEDTKRVVVLPSSVPRSCGNPYGSASIVFVITLQRILAEDVPVISTVSDPSTPHTNGESNSGALVPVQLELANVSPASGRSSSRKEGVAPGSAMDPTYTGAGIPSEHMAIVQKVAASINTTMTQIRDLEDKVVAFNEDWKQTVNRPKPSLLTPQALEQQVKHLIMENERFKDEISRRDELIRSIEERNRDLQKRMDKAAQIAQNLLDEKQATVSSTGDLRLEQDRQIMKLQEQITKTSTERDDIARHLETVKKMLDMSDSDLRDVKGRHEVFQVQLQALQNKLDAAEDQLGEERSRRKALEAKAAAVNEEIRQTIADVHMKSAQCQDLARKAESDRLHHAQLMEDERQRRAMETQQLRSEILNELQLREEKFQADRARVMEDHTARGTDEGREIGKQNAAIDVESKVQELTLDAQRAKTELDAYKTQVRESQEEAMNENRRLEAVVSTLKNSADAETRRKAQTEFKLQTMRTKVKSAEDSLFLQATNCAHRLRRPIPAENLMMLLHSIKAGENPDFSFQAQHHEEEAKLAHDRRMQWIAEELESQYLARQSSLFHQTYMPPLSALHDETVESVARLWKEREESFAGELLLAETQGRNEIFKCEDEEFSSYVTFMENLVAEQKSIVEEEETSRLGIADELEQEFDGLCKFVDDQRIARAELESEEEPLRREIEAEEESEVSQLQTELEKALFEKVIAEQQEIIGEESPARAAIEADLEEALSALSTEAQQSLDESKSKEELRKTQELEQKELEDAESPKRQEAEEESTREFEDLVSQERAERNELSRTSENPTTEASNPDPVDGAEAIGAPLGSRPVMLAESDSESGSDGGFATKIKPKASPAAAAKKSAPAASKPAKLFESDSEEDGAAAPAPPPKRKTVPKKAAAPAKLFDSDDE